MCVLAGDVPEEPELLQALFLAKHYYEYSLSIDINDLIEIKR